MKNFNSFLMSCLVLLVTIFILTACGGGGGGGGDEVVENGGGVIPPDPTSQVVATLSVEGDFDSETSMVDGIRVTTIYKTIVDPEILGQIFIFSTENEAGVRVDTDQGFSAWVIDENGNPVTGENILRNPFIEDFTGYGHLVVPAPADGEIVLVELFSPENPEWGEYIVKVDADFSEYNLDPIRVFELVITSDEGENLTGFLDFLGPGYPDAGHLLLELVNNSNGQMEWAFTDKDGLFVFEGEYSSSDNVTLRVYEVVESTTGYLFADSFAGPRFVNPLQFGW